MLKHIDKPRSHQAAKAGRCLFAAVTVGVLLAVAGCGTSGSAASVSDSATPSESATPSASATPSDSTTPSHPTGSAAEAFAEFAATGTDEVPWASSVVYSIGGTKVATFAPGASVADDLSSCLPKATEVEGHPCPVSPVTTLAATEPVFEESLPQKVGCNTFTAPKAPATATPTVIRPPTEARDCFSDFAVTLFADASGQVVWIDLALSGP